MLGLPWWSSCLPSNAGDMGSIPGQGTKIPHAVGQLSLCATTTEIMHLNWRARVLQTAEPTCSEGCVTTREKPTHCNERSLMPQRRSHMPQLRPDAAI